MTKAGETLFTPLSVESRDLLQDMASGRAGYLGWMGHFGFEIEWVSAEVPELRGKRVMFAGEELYCAAGEIQPPTVTLKRSIRVTPESLKEKLASGEYTPAGEELAQALFAEIRLEDEHAYGARTKRT